MEYSDKVKGRTPKFFQKEISINEFTFQFMSMNTIFQVPFFSSEAVSEQKFFQPLHWSISDVTTKERLSYDHLGDTRLEKQTDAQPPDAEHIRIIYERIVPYSTNIYR